MGFAHGWTYDHLAWRDLRDSPWFGAVPFLAAAATTTTTLRLGPMVTSPNFRHPVAFAREVVALDDISDGRLELGIGAGGGGWDATVLGQQPMSASKRVDRFAEFVEMTDRLLTDRTLTYQGQYFSADEARAEPGCRQRPRVPFVLAGTGAKSMRTVARHGQGWVTTGDPRTPQSGAAEGARVVEAQLALLAEACEREGRLLADLSRIVLLGPVLDQGLDSEAAFADTVGAYQAVGITDLVVHWPRSSPPYQGDRAGFEAAVLGQLRP